MADAKTLHCSVITPDRKVLECDASFVALPAHDGEIGFLTHRAPLLCKLGIGELRIETPHRQRRYFLDGGFAQMLGNELTILTERAESSGDIHLSQVEAELARAAAMTPSDTTSREARDLALARARARKRIAQKPVAGAPGSDELV